ncbi:hypothetical protein ILUMI_26511 [Ignelater luminosus]|uniref:DH domain-containing protein n=1 Tax=Ignelater luminosus TaxID=2038154 RepID=A0A8K0C5N8_IGNLU|nr:hypothetical protein ILUMI_26511 [Ignelater luminosus]
MIKMEKGSTRGYSVKEMIKMINSGKEFAKTNFHKPTPQTDVNEAEEDEASYDLLEKPPVKQEDVDTSSEKEESLSSDEEDDTSKDPEKFGRYMNIPAIVDEMKNFVREEENYCRSLEDLVENYIGFIETDEFDIYDVFGCINIISTYQNNTFLPALKGSRNVSKIADCFIMHKKLFNMYYDNYFKSKPNMMIVLKENKDVFRASFSEDTYKEYEDILFKSVNDRIQAYHDFLESTKAILAKNMDVSNFDRALEIIGNLTKYFSKKHENTRFIVSELVQTERIYVERLEKIVKEMLPIIEKLMKRKSKMDLVLGSVPEIYSEQQNFYDKLKKCLFDFDPNEVAECFLQHRNGFALYVKDQQMKKNLDTIEECREMLQGRGKSFDFHAPLNRLYKYKLLLHELKKSCEKGGLPFDKVTEALDMVTNVITTMNGVAAINSIKDENIDLDNQGVLLLRDEFVIQNEYLKCDAMIFLFEKSIVITQAKTEGSKKNRRDAFIYLNHIIIKYLALNVSQDSPTNFQIGFHGKYTRMTHTLQAKDTHTKAIWIKAVEDILMSQFQEEKKRNTYYLQES